MNLQAFKTLGQRVLETAREKITSAKKELGKLRTEAAEVPEVANYEEEADAEVKAHLSERSLSIHLLVVSAVAIGLKFLHNFFKREWLLAVVSLLSSVITAPLWIWTTLLGLSWAVMPLTCGVAMTVITWYTVFLDSCIPGVYPPSPESSKKQWFPSPAAFHLGYYIAMVNGIVLTLLIFIGNSNSLSP